MQDNSCNCDAAPLSVTGLLNNMTALTVTELNFSGLTYDIQTNAFRLGPLQCFDGTSFYFVEQGGRTVSVQLWKAGTLSSGAITAAPAYSYH